MFYNTTTSREWKRTKRRKEKEKEKRKKKRKKKKKIPIELVFLLPQGQLNSNFVVVVILSYLSLFYLENDSFLSITTHCFEI